MAIIRPFKGLRPLPQYVARVASRPYDVLSSEEARKEAGGNPLSFLHVGKPEIDLPRDINPYDERVYLKGEENFKKMIAEGILRQDDQPCLYLYSQTMGSHTQTGIVGCVSVQEYLDGTIKKHELTRADKEDDRTRHIDATNAQTGPIFLAYRAQQAIDALVEGLCSPMPEYDFRSGDGIRHRFWVIHDAAALQSVTRIFRGVRNLYIADGHHRAASAWRVAQLRTRDASNPTGEEEFYFFLAVLFPHNQLNILDYNRLVTDVNGRSTKDILNELGKAFRIEASASQVRPAAKGEFGMYLNGGWYRLKADSGMISSGDDITRLDVSILQNLVLGPVLGIRDPRTDKRIDFVGGIRGLSELEERVDSGEMAVAFSLYPTSIEELFAVADSGRVMPPKSTWFEPKLRDGIVVHMLE